MTQPDPLFAAAEQAAKSARYWREAADSLSTRPGARSPRDVCQKMARAYEQQVLALGRIAEFLAQHPPAPALPGLEVMELPDTEDTRAAHIALRSYSHPESLL